MGVRVLSVRYCPRLNGYIDQVEFDFIIRDVTPEFPMEQYSVVLTEPVPTLGGNNLCRTESVVLLFIERDLYRLLERFEPGEFVCNVIVNRNLSA